MNRWTITMRQKKDYKHYTYVKVPFSLLNSFVTVYHYMMIYQLWISQKHFIIARNALGILVCKKTLECHAGK
jgi:hypothetical protein